MPPFEKTKSRRLDGVRIAKEKHGISNAHIARKIGTTPSNLWSLLHSRASNSRFGALLDAWLDENVFLQEGGGLQVPETNRPPIPSHAVAREALRESVVLLKTLQKSIENDQVPINDRVDLLEANLRALLRIVPLLRV